MFDLDVAKMIVVGIVALAVIPPKDLPRVMRTVGQAVGKMRRMATEFQGQFMDAMREVEREADLESVKKEFQAINEQAKVDTAFDPVGMMRDDMTKAVQSPVEIGKSEIGKSEIDNPEIGKSEIALTAPEPAEASPMAVLENREAQPEAPAARQSAAE
jgi:sec-independent protein translocase protein TatB